jgi:outer membrane immunogenic protein
MKKLLFGAIAAIAIVASNYAMAADMPPAPIYTKAPAPVVAYNWTGFYLNAGGGYGMWNASETSIDAIPGFGCSLCAPQTVGGKGYFGTAGGGFDYQFSDRIVAGVLADYDFSSIKGTIQDTPETVLFSGTLKETSSWAAGARIGWLVTPQILAYFNGGATGTRFGSSSLTAAGSGGVGTILATPAFTKTGWFLGGGTETTLAPFLPAGWFWRSEYRYSDFGSSTVSDSLAGVAVDNITFKPTVQTLSTSIVYKFNWMGH